jgi:hypothetical protein
MSIATVSALAATVRHRDVYRPAAAHEEVNEHVDHEQDRVDRDHLESDDRM